MAKGDIAKANIEQKIKEVFGASYIATIDKKIYLNVDDGGAPVQIALSLTCPKNPVGTPTFQGGTNFAAMPTNGVELGRTTAEITDEEINNIKSLMASLGL